MDVGAVDVGCINMGDLEAQAVGVAHSRAVGILLLSVLVQAMSSSVHTGMPSGV